MSKLNPNAQKWVDALRSGEFKQASGRLCVVEMAEAGPQYSHCCLGVACEVFIKSGGELNKTEKQETSEKACIIYAKQTGFLPVKVKRWLGLCENDGAINGQESLTERNDHGASFAQIADIIESQPEGLFV